MVHKQKLWQTLKNERILDMKMQKLPLYMNYEKADVIIQYLNQNIPGLVQYGVMDYENSYVKEAQENNPDFWNVKQKQSKYLLKFIFSCKI